jgi:predicted ABC-class ATPase
LTETISSTELSRILSRLDGRGYGSYKDLYDYTLLFENIEYRFTTIQGDPHAPPSILEARIPIEIHKLGEYELNDPVTYKPLSDYTSRILFRVTRKNSKRCGNGNSCLISTPKPSPRILYRSTVTFDNTDMIIRIWVGLPASGRRVNGRMAYRLLNGKIPRVIRELMEHLENRDLLESHLTQYML